MSDTPYSNREIDANFRHFEEKADQRHAEKLAILAEITNQVRKTNGRVSTLERWQSYVLGFCACITMMIIPILITYINKHL